MNQNEIAKLSQNVYNRCKNNLDFINVWNDKISDMVAFSNSNSLPCNQDFIESKNQEEELVELYVNNKLVSFRPGCVESYFSYTKLFGLMLQNTHLHVGDIHMRQNAGLYYCNPADKEMVHNWYANHFKKAMENTTLTLVYHCLYHDLLMSSKLDLKKKYYSWEHLPKVILKNSANKKILFIGNAVESIQNAYDRGLENVWKFEVPKFHLSKLKTPQTTAGVKCFPHSNMIETTNYLIDEIKNKYSDFDTALFSCGAYGAPLINELQQIFPNKNLIYLGSGCHIMFGIISSGISISQMGLQNDCIRENLMHVLEPVEDPTHPEPKYWKR